MRLFPFILTILINFLGTKRCSYVISISDLDLTWWLLYSAELGFGNLKSNLRLCQRFPHSLTPTCQTSRGLCMWDSDGEAAACIDHGTGQEFFVCKICGLMCECTIFNAM